MSNRQTRQPAAALTALLVLMASASSTAAQPAASTDTPSLGVQHGTQPTAQPETHPAYDTLLTMLESPIAAERETALRTLAGDPGFTLDQLEETLRTRPLSAEQRFRLREAAKQRYMGSTRAAMGVQFSRSIPLAERVVIDRTYPEFPSFKVLKEGDMIVAVEGESLRSRDAWTRLGAHIVSHDPGDTLRVVVRRGEEKLELDIELGSYRDLPGQVPMDLPKLERGWLLRSASYLAADQAEPIAFNLPAGKWDAGMDQGDDVKHVRIKMQLMTGQPYRPRLTAGGEARGGEIDADEIWNTFSNSRAPNINQRRIRELNQAAMMQQDMFSGLRTMTIQQEIADLERYREQIKTAIARVGVVGDRPPPQQGDLLDWERGNMSQQRILQVTEQSLAALRAEAAEATQPDVPTSPGTLQP